MTLLVVAAVAAAAFSFFSCAQARPATREKVRCGTQLNGTVVAVAAWCCVFVAVVGCWLC